MDFVFFAGEQQTTLTHWERARMAGASIVDMTYALENQAGVQVRAPFVSAAMTRKAGAETLDFATVAVVAATPAAVMLALTAERLAAKLQVTSLAATFFEPASAHGREAMDELHQQTVSLLSLQEIPRSSTMPRWRSMFCRSWGRREGGPGNLREADRAALWAGDEGFAGAGATGGSGPVFHGYVASVLLELDREVRVDEVERALAGEGIDVVSEDSDPPSNLSAAGQEDVMVMVRPAAWVPHYREPAFLAMARRG